MDRTIYRANYWHYLTGDFLYRIHSPLRKILPTTAFAIYEQKSGSIVVLLYTIFFLDHIGNNSCIQTAII